MSTAIRRSAARLSSRRGAVFVDEAVGRSRLPTGTTRGSGRRSAIVAIADITARAKVDVRGRLPRRPSPADTVLARISAEWVVLLGAPNAEGRLIRAVEPVAGAGAMGDRCDAPVRRRGARRAGDPELVERATSWDLSTLPPGAATGAPIAEVRALLVRRDFRCPFSRCSWPWSSAGTRGRRSSIVTSLGGRPAGWQALRAEGWR